MTVSIVVAFLMCNGSEFQTAQSTTEDYIRAIDRSEFQTEGPK